MNLFWKKTITKYVLSLLGTLALAALFLSYGNYAPEIVRITVIIIVVATTIQRGVLSGAEHWLYTRWASRYDVSFEDIVYARYILKWDSMRFLHNERFKEEFEKERSEQNRR